MNDFLKPMTGRRIVRGHTSDRSVENLRVKMMLDKGPTFWSKRSASPASVAWQSGPRSPGIVEHLGLLRSWSLHCLKGLLPREHGLFCSGLCSQQATQEELVLMGRT